MPIALIVGIDSDLGSLVARHLEKLSWSVFGTTRRTTSDMGLNFYLDASNPHSIDSTIESFLEKAPDWDLVILAIGILDPIGKLTDNDFELWRKSIEVNFVNQIYFIRNLIKYSSVNHYKYRKFLTFAGSGTNSAPTNYSAYTLSKVALIKAMEILAAEYPPYVFLSLGTGWMKSEIHQQTIRAGINAGLTFEETKRRLEENDFGNPTDLLEFIDWFIACDEKNITGRNIALQGDDWKASNFLRQLTASDASFKLRRAR